MRTLCSLFLVMALASCSSYQYLTLESNQTSKNARKELVWENDTLRLVFNFNGAWGQMGVSIANKTAQPVSINWQKSSIIYGNSPFSLYDRNVRVDGEIRRVPENEKNPQPRYDDPVAITEASFVAPKEIDFLPPGTAISWQKVNTSKLVPDLKLLAGNLAMQRVTSNGFNIKYTTAVFDSTSSPFRFRLFLTYTIGSAAKEFYTSHIFYVTEVKQTEASGPHLIFLNGEGDKFYYRL